MKYDINKENIALAFAAGMEFSGVFICHFLGIF